MHTISAIQSPPNLSSLLLIQLLETLVVVVETSALSKLGDSMILVSQE